MEPSPGEDEVPVPPPLDDHEPPPDRSCDLVMTGGVASGVVYPWAIVEIARHFQLRNIGGTSVGAMAAALAAAAEYGRRTGYRQSYEVLRRAPGALGEVLPNGHTRMRSLFQCGAHGQRLLRLWGDIFRGQRVPATPVDARPGGGWRRGPPHPMQVPGLKAFGISLLAYTHPACVGALALGLLGQAFHAALGTVLLLALIGALGGLTRALWRDIRHGIIDNNLGLCTGATFEKRGPEGKRPGLCEWLHDNIQRSAGLKLEDRPLTFRDLWCAPEAPGAAPRRCTEDDPPGRRSINLECLTSNVTHGRPYRLPLQDSTSNLYYKRSELERYFPPRVMKALVDASSPYTPRSASDPAAPQDAQDFLQLPGADLPLVVAARLSLSFPVLFAAVPLWAVDYEAPRSDRQLRRCLFADGGATSNFPIHLFDAPLPRRPTFGMWLDRRDPRRPRRPDSQPEAEYVWLPRKLHEGRGDNWDRFDPLAAADRSPADARRPRSFCENLRFGAGFALALVQTATSWQDRTCFRLPHVRNRVARFWLDRGEGGLHIAMSRRQILQMAHLYGTTAGKLFVERYARHDGQPATAWTEHRRVRLQLLVDGLRSKLAGLQSSAAWSAQTQPLQAVPASGQPMPRPARPAPAAPGTPATPAPPDEERLLQALDALQRLEEALQRLGPDPDVPLPKPEWQMRAPL